MGNKPTCCGTEATWIDNIPGKEYYYCRTCKNEVLEFQPKEEDADGDYGQFWDMSGNFGGPTQVMPPPATPKVQTKPHNWILRNGAAVCANCSGSGATGITFDCPGHVPTNLYNRVQPIDIWSPAGDPSKDWKTELLVAGETKSGLKLNRVDYSHDWSQVTGNCFKCSLNFSVWLGTLAEKKCLK